MKNRIGPPRELAPVRKNAPEAHREAQREQSVEHEVDDLYPAGTPSPGRSRERRPRPRRPHTAATLLIERGVDISVVQEILGYSQLTTTKRYTHINSLGPNATGRASGSWRSGSPPRSLMVGRPGLELGTYGLKADRNYAGPCRTVL